jgi:hypothetical protein
MEPSEIWRYRRDSSGLRAEIRAGCAIPLYELAHAWQLAQLLRKISPIVTKPRLRGRGSEVTGCGKTAARSRRPATQENAAAFLIAPLSSYPMR